MSRHRESVAEVEAWAIAVRKAKRAAHDSLARANDAPGPHESTNTIFVGLYEAHLRDREALFAAMRELDMARDARRAIATGPTDGAIPFADRKQVG
ncbi:hypothetical protein GA829_30935 [Mesorhizobium sp. INR15]|nr:hypothetical protein GA829_30935 [Mesorhizobium sp. INR15]